jgi:hypothetical protein
MARGRARVGLRNREALGGYRIGDGPKPRLRFQAERVALDGNESSRRNAHTRRVD